MRSPRGSYSFEEHLLKRNRYLPPPTPSERRAMEKRTMPFDPSEIEEGRMTIFANKLKKNPKEPDFRCYFKLDGIDREFGIWKETAKSGLPYLSGKLSEGRPGPTSKKAESADDPFDF